MKTPHFDEWGLLPEGHEGLRDNPLLVTPVHVGPEVHAPEVVAGERAPPCPPEVAVGERVPPCAPEVAAPRPAGGGGGVPPVDAALVPTVEGYTPAPRASPLESGASRKRKEPGRRRNHVPRTLKKRKWIVVDE